MKPNDKAIEAAADAISLDTVFDLSKKECFDIAKVAVDAAYAAQFQSEDYAGLVKELRDASHCHQCVASGEKAADAIEALLAKRDELDKWLRESKQNFMRVDIERNNLRAERDALLAPLAPVDDYNLEIMAAKEFIEATTDMPPRTTYTISKRSLSGARNAIAAVRPHIEAAERERIKAAFEGTPLPLWVEQYEDQQPYRAATEYAEAIYAAIRSGK